MDMTQLSNEEAMDILADKLTAWPTVIPHVIVPGDSLFEFGATFYLWHITIQGERPGDIIQISRKSWEIRRDNSKAMTRVARAIKDAETGFVMQEARHAGFTGSPVLLAKALAGEIVRREEALPALGVTYHAAIGPFDFVRESARTRRWSAAAAREDGHVLYQTGDADAPDAILDRNGEVVLAQCRHCGQAEVELDGSHCPKAQRQIGLPRELAMPYAARSGMSVTAQELLLSGALVDAGPYGAALLKLAEVIEPERLEVVRRMLVLQDTCYGLAERAGWWKDLETGEDVRTWPKKHLDNLVSARLMLKVTEVAEAMEGHRKGLMDDKLPHRPMLEVELADAVIRIMDLAGGLNLDVPGAIVEKLAYNMSREDHKLENRKAAGGKSV